VLLVAGLLRPRLDLLIERVLAREQVALRQAREGPFHVLERVLDAVLHPRRLHGGVGRVLDVRLGDLVPRLLILDVVRVVPLDVVVGLRRGIGAAGVAGIARDHHEVAVTEPGGADREPARRLERNVVGRVLGRLAVLADVCAEERVVTGVARPRPVVDLAAVVAHGPRGNVDDADVLDLEHLDQLVHAAGVERRHVAAQPRAALLARRDLLLQAVLRLLLACDRILDPVEALAHRAGDVLVRLDDHHALRRSGALLVSARLREKSILDEVVLLRRVMDESVLHAVMVRDDETVGRHERCRATVGLHDGCQWCTQRIGERGRRDLHPHLLERFEVHRQRHLHGHPHAARTRIVAAKREPLIRCCRGLADRPLLVEVRRRGAELALVYGAGRLAAAACCQRCAEEECHPLHAGGISRPALSRRSRSLRRTSGPRPWGPAVGLPPRDHGSPAARRESRGGTGTAFAGWSAHG
jgi:hypothetical protein